MENQKKPEKKNNFNRTTITTGILTVLAILVVLISALGSKDKKLTVLKDSLEIELGTVKDLSLNVKEYFKVEDEEIQKITFDTSKVDLTKTGTYEIIAKHNGNEYTITVTVKDTTAPAIKMAEQLVFTNDLTKVNVNNLLWEVNDASDVSAKFIRFEKKEDLRELSNLEVDNLKASLGTIEKSALKDIGTPDIPTEEGIYHCVIEVSDVHGNSSYEEVYVVLDTTPAEIHDVADMEVKVKKEKIYDKPELDMSIYTGYDKVDGALTSNEMLCEVIIRDIAKHEWSVKVSYTDRAGNKNAKEFLVTVTVEETTSTKPSTNQNTQNNQNNQTNQNHQNNQSSDKNTQMPPNITTYDTRDENKDGYVSTDEEMRYITPEKQACIDAGYGVVVEFDGGEWYGVLMKNSSHTIDGKNGGFILFDYLQERGLDGHVGGCWINSDKEWYWFTATDIVPYDEWGDIS